MGETMAGALVVPGDPYDYAFDLEATALMIIDMQADFCGPGGYVDAMGYDISLTACAIEPIKESAGRGAAQRHDHHSYARRPPP